VGELTHIALEKEIRNVDLLARYRPEIPHTWLEDAVTLARNFDKGDAFSRFRGVAVERERPVSLVLEGLRLNGTADLVGEDWVLDYKTDREMIPEDHRFQLWAYATALERREAHIAYLRHDGLYEMDATELEASGSEVQSVVRGILNGDYTAKPDLRKCRECPYFEICEYRS
jgi:ATP-dependent helicase/nuclease subunit A